MPYVWVDPSEMECDGDCAAATDLRGVVHQAVDLLNNDCPDDAYRLLREALGVKILNERERRISKFADWMKAGRPVPFWEWERMA